MLGLTYKLQNIINQSTDAQDTSIIIATYLLENIENASSFTIKTICDDCGVSPGSITRFSKKLSYNGFSELCKAISELSLEKTEMAIDLEINKLNDFQSYSEYTKEYVNRITYSLTSLSQTDNLSQLSLIEVTDLILRHNRIVFFATQVPASLITITQHELLTFGKLSQFYALHKDQMNLAKALTKDDLVFFISLNGSYIMQKDLTLNLFKSDAYKILITQNSHLKLSGGFDKIIILGESDDEIVGKYKLTFYFEQLMRIVGAKIMKNRNDFLDTKI